MAAFAAMLTTQAVCFVLLPHATAPALFVTLAALVYLCYGGGFGTMPATAGDFFGLRHGGAIYGLMIIGWSIGGVIGPLLVAALVHGASYTTAFTTVAGLAAVAVVLPALTSRVAGELFVDLFNVLDNQDSVRNQDLVAGQGGTAFGQPLQWVQPRRAFLGARLRF